MTEVGRGLPGLLGLVGLVGLLVAPPVTAQGPRAAGSGDEAAASRTYEVRMVDVGPARFVFEPADVSVRPGDRIVWTQAGVMPHNVEFKTAPEGSDLNGLPMSPFLTTRGQQYELVIDERFVAGKYYYVCTPHVDMGMRGTITVLPPDGN